MSRPDITQDDVVCTIAIPLHRLHSGSITCQPENIARIIEENLRHPRAPSDACKLLDKTSDLRHMRLVGAARLGPGQREPEVSNFTTYPGPFQLNKQTEADHLQRAGYDELYVDVFTSDQIEPGRCFLCDCQMNLPDWQHDLNIAAGSRTRRDPTERTGALGGKTFRFMRDQCAPGPYREGRRHVGWGPDIDEPRGWGGRSSRDGPMYGRDRYDDFGLYGRGGYGDGGYYGRGMMYGRDQYGDQDYYGRGTMYGRDRFGDQDYYGRGTMYGRDRFGDQDYGRGTMYGRGGDWEGRFGRMHGRDRFGDDYGRGMMYGRDQYGDQDGGFGWGRMHGRGGYGDGGYHGRGMMYGRDQYGDQDYGRGTMYGRDRFGDQDYGRGTMYGRGGYGDSRFGRMYGRDQYGDQDGGFGGWGMHGRMYGRDRFGDDYGRGGYGDYDGNFGQGMMYGRGDRDFGWGMHGRGGYGDGWGMMHGRGDGWGMHGRGGYGDGWGMTHGRDYMGGDRFVGSRGYRGGRGNQGMFGQDMFFDDRRGMLGGDLRQDRGDWITTSLQELQSMMDSRDDSALGRPRQPRRGNGGIMQKYGDVGGDIIFPDKTGQLLSLSNMFDLLFDTNELTRYLHQEMFRSRDLAGARTFLKQIQDWGMELTDLGLPSPLAMRVTLCPESCRVYNDLIRQLLPEPVIFGQGMRGMDDQELRLHVETTIQADLIAKFCWTSEEEGAETMERRDPATITGLGRQDTGATKQFHGVVVGAVAEGRHMRLTREGLEPVAGSSLASLPPRDDRVRFVVELVRLERAIIAAEHYYGPGVVQGAALVSPTFERRSPSELAELAHLAVESFASYLPNLAGFLHEGRLSFLGQNWA
jgi:hypothetical protein